MAKKPDQQLLELLDKYKFNVDKKDTVWDCQGTWVLKYKYVEEIGRQAKVYIDKLDIIEINTEKRIAVVKCEAQTDKKKVITYGESSPHNTFNKYPVAMAEKRAVGRAILKLAGLHGDFYEDKFSAEEEATAEEEEVSTKKNKSDSKSSYTSSLPANWKSMSLAEQVQHFSAEIDKASDDAGVEERKKAFSEWYDDLDREAKKEIVQILKEKKKGIK